MSAISVYPDKEAAKISPLDLNAFLSSLTRVEIKLYKLWGIWVITFFGYNCHFVQNSLIIFNVVLIQNSQFYSKCKPKSKAIEIF